ncbi:flagellum-associated coiled-coil domain-containing protein 1 [Discoglossus pictus]
MPSGPRHPHLLCITPRFGNENQPLGRSSVYTSRPRTSPAACSPFRDPGRDHTATKPFSNLKLPGSARLTRRPSEVMSDAEYLVISPGYTMTRSKSHIAVRLGEEFFQGVKPTTPPVKATTPPINTPVPRVKVTTPLMETKTPPAPTAPRVLVHNGMEDVVEHLQEQIGKLTAMLEQERKDHQETHRRLTKQLAENITEIQMRNEEEFRTLQSKHSSELSALKEENNSKLEEEKEEAAKVLEALQRDYDLLEGSFKTYKESVLEEVNDTWQKKQIKWKEEAEEEKQLELRRQKHELLEQFEAEKNLLQKKTNEELGVLQQSHEKQMDDAWRKYREVNQESKILQKSKEFLQADLEEKKNQIVFLNSQIQQAKIETGKLKIQMKDAGKGVEHQISKAQAKQRQIIQSLMNENADLRRKLIAKNEQLYSERRLDVCRTQTLDTLSGLNEDRKEVQVTQHQPGPGLRSVSSAGLVNRLAM